MKKTVVVLCCSIVMFLAGGNTSFATLISGGAFDGWDADPAVAISSDNLTATLKIQAYDDYITSIYLSRTFTGVSAISFEVNFVNGLSREISPSALEFTNANFLQVSFLADSGDQIDFLGYDKNGAYNPATLDSMGAYGSPYIMNIANLGGIDGTLYFILQDMGDQYFDSATVTNVNVTENQAAPVPEPSTLLLLGVGLAALCFMRSRKRETDLTAEL
jgi:hypothetical protein